MVYLTVAAFAGGVVVGHLFVQRVIDFAKAKWSAIRNKL